MSRRYYHPANKALSIFEARTKPTSTETNLTFDTTFRNIKPQDKEHRIYSRLINAHHLLPDLAANVIYPKEKLDKDGTTLDAHVKTMTHIAHHSPINLPICCSFHQKQVNKVVIQHKKFLYNSPEPPPLVTPQTKDRLEKLVCKNGSQNGRKQYPLNTVIVQWRNKNTHNIKTIYQLMKQFGPVEYIQHLSDYTAAIIYYHMEDSCHAVSTKLIGPFESQLHCDWLHRSMNSRRFYGTGRSLKAINDDLLCPSL